MYDAQTVTDVMNMIERLSDDMLVLAVTLIEGEQLKRANEAKELKDDEMRYEAEGDGEAEGRDKLCS